MGKIKTFVNLILHDSKGLSEAIAGNISKMKIAHLIPDKAYLKYMYQAHFGKKLNLKSPKTFNEKLQWLKLYNRDLRQIKLVDKYEVKNYIASTIGEEYVIPTLGVYNNFDDIDFSKLPEQFVLKCTHDSGSVVICRNKHNFDIEAARKKINKKLKQNLFWYGREWPYKNLKPRIIAEQYMEDSKTSELRDYKFYCFNGEPKFLYVSEGLADHSTAKLCFLNMDWTFAPFQRSDFENFDKLPEKPQNYEKMCELAGQLSKNIPFLRVDLYEINGKIYFSELTFSPGAGFTKFDPEQWDYTLGEWINLPEKKDCKNG